MTDEAAIGKVYDAQLMARLLRYLRPYRAWVAASVCLLIVHSVLGVAGPYLTKVLVDRYLTPQQAGNSSALDPLLPSEPVAGIQALVLIYLATLVLGFVIQSVQIYVMNYTGQRVMHDLRLQIFRHLQRMAVSFFDRNPVGRLVTRVTTDVDVLNEMFTSGVAALAGDLVTLLFIVAVMVYLSPGLTLALFCVAPLVLLVSFWFRKKARDSYRKVRTAVAKINAFLQEHFSGVAVIQLFNHERRSRRDFGALNAEHREAQREAIRAHAYFYPAVEWFGMLGIAVVLVYGGRLILDGEITIGVVVAFLQYGTRVFRPLQDLSEKYNILQGAMASSERIFKLLDTPATEQEGLEDAPAAAERATPSVERGSPQPQPSRRGHEDLRVEFQNVWFAYKDEDWVLRDVSFTIEPREMLAVVGHTGAGKTTLISLLLRFYEAQKGRIVVGGRDVREWSFRDLRRQFGIVLQDPYIFSGTIASNIRLDDSAIPDARVEQVAREVNLGGLIDALPNGIHESVRERGDSLSSGQKQLISFARALVPDPRFLVLDEATSSVDTATELKIREALSRMLSSHTSIVIAHRLSTIKRASRILVMHKGEVREHGTHQQLLQQRGIYWKLYELQYREQEIEEVPPDSVSLPEIGDGPKPGLAAPQATEVSRMAAELDGPASGSPADPETSEETPASLSVDSPEDPEGQPLCQQDGRAATPRSNSSRPAHKESKGGQLSLAWNDGHADSSASAVTSEEQTPSAQNPPSKRQRQRKKWTLRPPSD